MSKPTRRAFDVSTAISTLKAGEHKAFVKAVQRFHAAFSVSLDLQACMCSVIALEKLSLEPAGETDGALGDALFTQAVISYCRAAHSTSSNRFMVGVTAAYDEDQKKMHKHITTIRDKSLAHSGRGESLWFDERVVLVETETRAGIVVVHKRMNFATTIVGALKGMLEVAIAHLSELQRERALELANLLDSVPSDLGAVIDRFPFDPEQFYSMSNDDFWGDKAFSTTRNE